MLVWQKLLEDFNDIHTMDVFTHRAKLVFGREHKLYLHKSSTPAQLVFVWRRMVQKTPAFDNPKRFSDSVTMYRATCTLKSPGLFLMTVKQTGGDELPESHCAALADKLAAFLKLDWDDELNWNH